MLGDLGVEVVHQHPQRRLGLPAPARSARCRGAAWMGRSWVAFVGRACRDHQRALRSLLRRRTGRHRTRPARRRPRSRATGIGRARARRRRARSSRRYDGAGRWRGDVPAVAPRVRRSRPRAAVSSSIARTRVRPSTDRRSLRAADQPIDTWSSCIALDGIESTLAGHRQPLELGDDRRLGVLGDHQAAVDARVVGQERRQAVVARAGRGTGRCAARTWRRRRRRRSPGSRARRRPARRGSCRWTRPGRRRRDQHDRVVDGAGQLAAGDGGGVRRRCRARRRAPAASSAASRRPAPGGSGPRGGWPSRRSRRARARRLAADSAWPSCGRSACRSAAKTRSVPICASTLIAAAMSAVRSSMPQVGDREHQHRRACRRCR